MKQHRKPPVQVQINGIRLIAQELHEIRRGLSCYSGRAVNVARDIGPSKHNNLTKKIATLGRSLDQTLILLEEKIQ